MLGNQISLRRPDSGCVVELCFAIFNYSLGDRASNKVDVVTFSCLGERLTAWSSGNLLRIGFKMLLNIKVSMQIFSTPNYKLTSPIRRIEAFRQNNNIGILLLRLCNQVHGVH